MKTRQMAAALGCIALLASACTTTNTSGADSSTRAGNAKRESLDAAVDSALTSLYAQVPGSREMVRNSRGVLVFPSIVSAGLVVGASYGQGALREGAITDGYYSSGAGAVGLIAGAESKSIYVLFMTQASLDQFKASKGWTAGVDASVTFLKAGADGKVSTQTAQQPIVGYALTNGGLMANLSIEGTKFSRIQL